MKLNSSPISPLDLSYYGIKNEVFIKRDDLIHPIISGNKWRKLKLNIEKYESSSFKGIISMGGAFSSHILALSYVCYQKKIPCVLLIRGEKPKKNDDIILKCIANGAIIRHLSRTDYSNKIWVKMFAEENYPSYYFIPEGGGNKYGLNGCKAIVREISIEFDELFCDVGTGTTLAGISNALKAHQKANGIVVLKGAKNLEKEIEAKYSEVYGGNSRDNWSLIHDYHFGGYAKYNHELIRFMQSFYEITGIKTDPIYSGKMFYGLIDVLKEEIINPSKKIIALHSGGLTGIRGYENRYGVKIY